MKDSKDSFGMQIYGQYTKGDKWSHLNSRKEKEILLRVFLLASTYVVMYQPKVMSFYNRQLKLPALLFSCLSRFPSATFIL